MTPLIGIVLAIFVALLAPNVRGIVVSMLVLLVLATAVQTYDLDADWGSNPPSTVHQVAYCSFGPHSLGGVAASHSLKLPWPRRLCTLRAPSLPTS